jgi:hypothetical protein
MTDSREGGALLPSVEAGPISLRLPYAAALTCR